MRVWSSGFQHKYKGCDSLFKAALSWQVSALYTTWLLVYD